MTTVANTEEVEIAPGKWLAVETEDTTYASDVNRPKTNPHNMTKEEARQAILDCLRSASKNTDGDEGESALRFGWKGKTVEWKGKEIPITLREHEGTLYMVGFNREDLEKTRFVLFGLNDEGTGFAEIEREQFPKSIATQNMWLRENGRYGNIGGKVVDKWKGLRNLNPNNPAFDGGLTARLWVYLETGKQHYQQNRFASQELLKKYVKEHNPVALPTIVREPKKDENVESGSPAKSTNEKGGRPTKSPWMKRVAYPLLRMRAERKRTRQKQTTNPTSVL